MLRLCQGRPSRAKPHHYIVLLCLNSEAVGIRSEYFPLWVSDLVELNHYLQVKFGSSTHPTLKFVQCPGFLSHLSWELSNRWWANLTNGIQNFPQNNLIQTATFANMPAFLQPQKPSKRWLQNKILEILIHSTILCLRHLEAHSSLKPPTSVRELWTVDPHCESLTMQWFKKHWVGSQRFWSQNILVRQHQGDWKWSHWRGKSFLWSTCMFKVLQTTNWASWRFLCVFHASLCLDYSR